MKRYALLIGLGLALTLFFAGGAAKRYTVPFIRQLNDIAYDSKLRLTMPQTADSRIVILDIDAKSLKEEGRWPWRRDRVALLVDKLFDRQHVAEVGFDVVFAEPDESSGLKVLQQLAHYQLRHVPQFQAALEAIRPHLEYDRILANALEARPVVLGYYFTGGNGNVSGALPPPVFAPGTFDGFGRIPFVHWSGYGGNLPELQKNAAGAGHFNPIVDDDGMVRRLPMIVEYKGAYYESLSLAMARLLHGPSRLVPGREEGPDAGYSALEWVKLVTPDGKYRIPMDVVREADREEVSTLIPYRGPRGTFPYVSVTDVLHDRIPADQLKGKIVLVGTSVPSLLDLRSTPVDTAFPGVEVHANMLAGILNHDLKQRPAYMMGIEVVVLLTMGGLLSFILPRMRPISGALAVGGALAIIMSLDLLLWQRANLDLPVANSVALVLGLFVLNMSLGYFMEERRKRQITGLFGQYVPAELVDEMSRRPEEASMESESREMTILFSDVRGFTSIAEQLDPRELSQMMNEFLTAFTRVIHRHRGTIDKYMGDCIMAFWGAPLHSGTHARDAVLAGMEMFRVLHELQEKFAARGWPAIRMGVGINTGRVSVGNMGSEVRRAYTVMGDVVNLASRLESITKQYRVDFIVGEETRNAAAGVVYRELDLVRVKGKDRPVAIFEPVGREGEVGAAMLEEVALFQQALRFYRSRDWDNAELRLLDLQRMHPKTRLYQVFAERIAEYRLNPPPADWNGIFDWQTK